MRLDSPDNHYPSDSVEVLVFNGGCRLRNIYSVRFLIKKVKKE